MSEEKKIENMELDDAEMQSVSGGKTYLGFTFKCIECDREIYGEIQEGQRAQDIRCVCKKYYTMEGVPPYRVYHSGDPRTCWVEKKKKRIEV